MLGHQSWQAWFLCILITSSYCSNDMFIKVETCLNLSEEGGPLEGISIIKPWEKKLKLLSCSGPSNSRLCVIFLIVYGFCSEAWFLVMSLRRQLSIQYHPRCLLYKRPKLLDFSHNLSPLHFLMMVPSHSPSQALSQGFPSRFAESQGLQPERTESFCWSTFPSHAVSWLQMAVGSLSLVDLAPWKSDGILWEGSEGRKRAD